MRCDAAVRCRASSQSRSISSWSISRARAASSRRISAGRIRPGPRRARVKRQVQSNGVRRFRGSMSDIDRVRRILRDALQLGARADALGEQSQLLGSIPEFDSMAIVSVIGMIEEEYGFTV